MAINVKIYNKSGKISTQTIPSDDPDDPTLSQVLGGHNQSGLVLLAVHDGWDFLRLSDSDNNILIVGVSPTMGVLPQVRQSCNLSDTQINGLLEFLELK